MSAIDDDDLPVTPEEAAEAEALARVLGKQRTTSTLPFDALAAARLVQLHHAPSDSEASGHLRQADADRILERVLAEAKLPAPVRVSASLWERFIGWLGAPTGRAWALAGSSVALVSVLALSLSLFGPMGREPTLASVRTDDAKGTAAAVAAKKSESDSDVPEPPLELLRAQAAWIAAPNERAAFARGMRDYRGEVYLALGEQ